MANNLNTNPIYIDTWAADVTLVAGIANPKMIHFMSDTAADNLVLVDKNGNVMVDITLEAAVSTEEYWFPFEGWQCDGLILDVSLGTYNTAKALIYL